MNKWYFAIFPILCLLTMIFGNLDRVEERHIGMMGFISLCTASILHRMDKKDKS